VPHEGRDTTARRSRLLDELRQNLPFRSTAQEAFLALLRTADLAKHRFSALFEPEGVTFQQYNVLRILRGAGQTGLPTLEIAERMIERTPGVTRIVDRLEAKGWVQRDRSSEDRRRVWCRITDQGLGLLARLDGPVDAADVAAFEGLETRELQELIRILDSLRERMNALPEGPSRVPTRGREP
jgi:DNA-binding MarR family transcriptional regulator